MRNNHKAIFLDKDGTLIEDVPYNIDPEKVRVYNDVPSALILLKEHGYKLIVISNQPGVAHGYFTREALERSNRYLLKKIHALGVTIDGFYYCPHHHLGVVPDYRVECDCRKPKAGLLLQAAKENNIDLSASWMIGDILNDVEAGIRAGCRTVLIDNGNETEWEVNRLRVPFYIAKNMTEAAHKILWGEVMEDSVYEKSTSRSDRKI